MATPLALRTKNSLMLHGGLACPLLFVYGTLMTGHRHPMGLRLAAESASLGPGTIQGRLYDLGRYPAAVPTGDPGERVHGEVVRLHSPARSLIWLDAYEGCGPGDKEPQAYKRVITPVCLQSGHRLHAWVYYYNWPIGKARHLPGGRYRIASPPARRRI